MEAQAENSNKMLVPDAQNPEIVAFISESL